MDNEEGQHTLATSDPGPTTMTRRKFLVYAMLGATSIALGDVLLRRNGRSPSKGLDPSARAGRKLGRRPALRPAVTSRQEGDLRVYEYKQQGEGGNTCSCGVNRQGVKVIELLDGKHSVADICALSAQTGGHADDSASRAEIAEFVAQLGALGFLATPYYAHIFENYS